jgi:hypothetical protein
VSALAQRRSDRGTTMVELLLCAVLGSLVLMLALSMLMIQSRVHNTLTDELDARDVAESAATFASEELKNVMRGGIVYAGPDSVVYRYPSFVGSVCNVLSGVSYMYLPYDGGSLPTAQVSGVATRDDAGSWTFYDATWSQVGFYFATSAATSCAAAGADTVGAITRFAYTNNVMLAGQLVMIYQTRRLFTGASSLNPGRQALYYAATGESTREVASGLDPATTFWYRSANGSWASSVSTGLGAIGALSLDMRAVQPGSGEVERWTATVWLTNGPN